MLTRRHLLAGGVAMAATQNTATAQPKPITRRFLNPTSISIPEEGPATLYPSIIRVSGFERSEVRNVVVTLRGFSHEFPADVRVILQASDGRRILLMQGAGSSNEVQNLVLTFSDQARQPLPHTGGRLFSDIYLPENSFFPRLEGTNPNGAWKLFVVDSAGLDAGIIAGGWALRLLIRRRAGATP